MRLSPNPDRLGALWSDYQNMSEMFFDEIPAFDEILDSLADLEARINAPVIESRISN